MGKKKLVSCCCLVGAVCIYTVSLILWGKVKEDGLEDRAVQGSLEWMPDSREQEEEGIQIYDDQSGHFLEKGSEWSGSFQVKEGDDWEVLVSYAVTDDGSGEFQLDWEIDGAEYCTQLPAFWQDDRERLLDRYGNELNARPALITEEVRDYLIQKNDVGRRRLVLHLDPGIYEYTVRADSDIRIYGLHLVKSGGGHMEVEKDKGDSGQGNLLMLEAENSLWKSDSDIRGKSVKNAVLTPYDTKQNKINVIDASSWTKVGQKVVWAVEVPDGGWYRIGFRYSQYSEANKSSYRTLAVDGRYVADSAHPIQFAGTAMNSYANLTVAEDGEDCWIYLEDGVHTISMEAVMDPLLGVYDEILAIMGEVNDISMALRKMSAGSPDANRTWDMDTYLPDVPSRLEPCRERIEEVYQSLWDIEGAKPSYENQL